MGLLEPHARHRGRHGKAGLTGGRARPSVVVHGLGQALAAREAAEACGSPIEIWSAVGAAAYLGPLFWQKLEEQARAAHPKLAFICVLDCAERPGDAMAGMRQGVKDLCFTGRADVA